MEKIRFEKDSRRKSAPSTKLYAPERDSGHGRRGPKNGETAPDRPAPAVIKPQSQMKLGARIGIVFCLFVAAGMLVFILSGYERISRAYAQINTLNSEIDEIKLRINALEADIECAVTLEDAQAYAKSHGMRYPVQSQYLQSGSPIPVTGTVIPGGDTPTGAAPEENGGQTP